MSTQPEDEGWTDVASAAPLLKKSAKAVYADCGRGLLPHRRLGRRILISRAELHEYIARLPGVSLAEAIENQQKRAGA